MDSEISVFLSVLKRKLIGLDPDLSFSHQHIPRDSCQLKEFWGGESIKVGIQCLRIDKPTAKWIIRRLQEFGFTFELYISRYILDPRLKEVELEYRYYSNCEFYLKIKPTPSIQLSGLCIYQFDAYGYHVTNRFSAFEEDERKKYVLRKNVLTVYPVQNN